MTRAGLVLGCVCAGCPGAPSQPTGPDPTPVAVIDAAPRDAPAVSEDEKLALVGHAMTELAPVASQCWAAGAVDDYLLQGTVTLQIAPHGDGARVAVVHDTTDDPVLTGCLQSIASAYAWPAALAGEVYELPFSFTAPNGQYVIDRRLVPIVGQNGVGIRVLLDEKSSGNPAASMLELTFKPGATLALAQTERHEVWYLENGTATLGKAGAVRPGDLLDIPAGAYREVTAGEGGLTAVVVLVPGGIEGVARGGALPGKTVFGALAGKNQPGPRVILEAKATTWKADKRVVQIYLDSAAKGAAKDIAAAVIELGPGAAVPEHVHANETELLYVTNGAATMVIDGVTLPITDTTVVQIPKGTRHQATVTEGPLDAIQLYTPGGPEQRFKQ